MSRLITAEEDGDRLTERELYAVMMDIISAGHDTSSNMMINGVAYLLDHPTHFARLRQQPSLVDVTVEELLRLCSRVQTSLTRVATEEV